MTDNVLKLAYAGMVLRQAASHAFRRNSQDVIFLKQKLSLSIDRMVSDEFYLPAPQLVAKNDNNFNMSLTFVGPWNNRLPNIAVISPSGTKYGSRNDDGNLIAQKWSSNVST